MYFYGGDYLRGIIRKLFYIRLLVFIYVGVVGSCTLQNRGSLGFCSIWVYMEYILLCKEEFYIFLVGDIYLIISRACTGSVVRVGFKKYHFLRPDLDLATILNPDILVSPCDSLIVDFYHIFATQTSDFPFPGLAVEED